MSRIVLVTGGCRSGKSAYAQKLAEGLAGPRVYLATCPVLDEEIRRRIELHRRARASGGWLTVEEPLDVAGALRSEDPKAVVLLDCLSLWVGNLMHRADQAGRSLEESDVAALGGELVAACGGRAGATIMVTNEVGMGIVPDNAPARRYRDLAGRLNQVVAAAAQEVFLMSCGIALALKKDKRHEAAERDD